mgnify:CR=1 FL=1
MQKLGKQTITVSYGGKTTSYEVNVKDYVTGISITPNAITGTYNDELGTLINDNDIIYTVTYAKAVPCPVVGGRVVLLRQDMLDPVSCPIPDKPLCPPIGVMDGQKLMVPVVAVVGSFPFYR